SCLESAGLPRTPALPSTAEALFDDDAPQNPASRARGWSLRRRGSMVGFVALLGITLRNSILMIAHYERLVGVEDKPWSFETGIEGAADRLTAILMTRWSLRSAYCRWRSE